MDELLLIAECHGFEWDTGNQHKNWLSHKVSPLECEEIFFNKPLLLADDTKHSKQEKRYYALGHSNNERNLFVAFTIRKGLIRIISARDMSRKERKTYEQT